VPVVPDRRQADCGDSGGGPGPIRETDPCPQVTHHQAGPLPQWPPVVRHRLSPGLAYLSAAGGRDGRPCTSSRRTQ
jgi:hypothetical protein